jgi:photosystem II stability/assembly factor-like uncharacterized protein
MLKALSSKEEGMTLRPYRWLHAATGLSLGILLALPAGAQTAAPASGATAGKRSVPSVVRQELLKIQQEPLRHDEPAEAAEYLRQRRAPAGQKDVPVERYLQALQKMQSMQRYSTANRAVLPPRAAAGNGISSATDASVLNGWSALGPGNIGGRTRAIVIHPTNPQIMYAAGVAGGVWKSTNGGASWTPLGDFLANIAVTTLVMSPKNPEVLYAGTGEGFYNGDAIRGNGIFRTADGGATWTQLAGTTGSDFYYVNDIVVSTARPSRIYAATRTGVWRSLDSGATWTRKLDPQVFGGCLDLAIRTDRTADVVFASCGTFEQASVYRNTAAQTNGAWKKVLSDPGMGRTSLAIAPSNQNILYAMASSNVQNDYLDGLHGVFRSSDGGSTWKAQVRNTSKKKLNTSLLSNPIFVFFQECFGAEGGYINQGWYDNVIAVDPKDPNRVWAGGIDLFRSDDGGKNWGLTSYWWAQLDDGSYLPSYSHADQHVIVFHPQYNGTSNRTMFVGSDGGIYKNTNARAETIKNTAGVCDPFAGLHEWESLNNGYAVTQFYHGVPYPDGTTYFGGAQDNGTIRGNDADGANAWAEIFGGDGAFVAINPDDTDVLYASTPGLALRKSTDGGVTFARKTNGITESSGNFLFVTPYVMDPSNPDRLWIGGSQLWRTDDAAESWNAASRKVAGVNFPIVSAIAVAPTDSNRVLAGTVEGFIHRNDAALSATGDTRWARNQPRTGWVSWLAYDPVDANVAYATFSSFGGGAHVWKSTNGGTNWEPLDGTGTGTLPDVPANTIVIDPANRSHLYVGTDVGLFSSIDGGQTWMVENTGFPNTPVWALALQQSTPGGPWTLFAFTHGRGAWKVQLP